MKEQIEKYVKTLNDLRAEYKHFEKIDYRKDGTFEFTDQNIEILYKDIDTTEVHHILTLRFNHDNRGYHDHIILRMEFTNAPDKRAYNEFYINLIKLSLFLRDSKAVNSDGQITILSIPLEKLVRGTYDIDDFEVGRIHLVPKVNNDISWEEGLGLTQNNYKYPSTGLRPLDENKN